MLEAYGVSGLTQKAFAEQHGLAYSTLVYWLKLRRRKKPGEGESKCVSLFRRCRCFQLHHRFWRFVCLMGWCYAAAMLHRWLLWPRRFDANTVPSTPDLCGGRAGGHA
ncbi:IS66 family insertion sequence element accessory protein TnpA [Cerasicoccus arenae]|uniref:IS66 family insertion sequence element accessory protein TnpA n=1 Tax=Cerasicoccus arenae TaxID=424488 RepID=UPI003CCCD0AE